MLNFPSNIIRQGTSGAVAIAHTAPTHETSTVHKGIPTFAFDSVVLPETPPP